MMKNPRMDPVREHRIHEEAIVDAGPDEQALGWYYYLESKLSFPFQAKCRSTKITSPLTTGELVDVLRMAPEDACMKDMLVLVRWQGRKLAVPLSQLAPINPDDSTEEAVGDWQYWGLRLPALIPRLTHPHRNLTDILVQPKRDRFAAIRFFRKLLRTTGREPRVIITDKLRLRGSETSGNAGVAHRQHRYLNNRAENSHQPTREPERRMRRFKTARHAQRFVEVHGIVASHFCPRRHLLPAADYRELRSKRFRVWNEVTQASVLA